MKPRERVFAALNLQIPDRVPRVEGWIDALLDDLGQQDLQSAHVNLGQDSIMIHSQSPPTSNAWRNGVDEWGRLWMNGMYVSGVVNSMADIKKYSMRPDKVDDFFDEEITKKTKSDYPDHCLMYGSHLGPFMAAYMAMGFEEFFLRIIDDPAFIHALIEDRTEWTVAMFKKAVALGAEVLVIGDDAAHKEAPMISPKMWREFVLPYHRVIVDAVDKPMIFHSDGNILQVLPMIIDAGFIGYHSLEPAAGIDLGEVKKEYGKDLVLIGNVDVSILAGDNPGAVRDEVDRCISQGAPGGGYMISSCNSIFDGLNPKSVAEMFRYTGEVGYY
ncbi:MAG: uroporphyrinogen decarboxylase family protein [Anaerolineaceae bacterium]|nr:uroporphyrinogen decarboxylase family protein [Anaerolineaceae bacterium]